MDLTTNTRLWKYGFKQPGATMTSVGPFLGSRSRWASVLVIAVVCACGAIQSQEPGGTATLSQSLSIKSNYRVTNLGTLGGVVGAAFGINNHGDVTGDSDLFGDQTEHGFIWANGTMTDFGSLGGFNSSTPSKNADGRGLFVGSAQTPVVDPNGETYSFYFCATNFCAGLSNQSLPVVWQDGNLTALPTLGGNQGQAIWMNEGGVAAGFAETATIDASCAPPQVHDTQAAVWTPDGRVFGLGVPVAGDSISQAASISSNGDVVGCSGPCTSIMFINSCAHALFWKKVGDDHSPHWVATKLPDLRGAFNNLPFAVNEHEQAAGISDLPGDTINHAVVWDHGKLLDLGTLSGDAISVASGINNRGQVVGSSCDLNFNCRGFIWEDGVMTDLNTLVPPGSMSIISANDLNDRGEIAAQGFDSTTGISPALLLTPEGPRQPRDVPRVNLSSRVQQYLKFHFRRDR